VSEGLDSNTESKSTVALRTLVIAAVILILGSALFGIWTSWRSVTAAAPGLVATLEPRAQVESVRLAGLDSFRVSFVAAGDSSLRGSVFVIAPWFDGAITYSEPHYDQER